MKLTTKRGVTYEIADEHWQALENRFGARSREMALTYLCRADSHRKLADTDLQPTEEWLDREMETQKLMAQAERFYADQPSRYADGAVVLRVLQGRVMSAGMLGELCEIGHMDVSDVDLRQRAVDEWKRQMAFGSRLSRSNIADFYQL